MLRSRKTEDFNLAFLDVMSCGLGAVILIFLLIKHNTDRGSVESEILLSQLESMRLEEVRLEQQIKEVSKQNSDTDHWGKEQQQKKIALQKALAAIDKKTALQQKSNQQLKSANEQLSVQHAADIVSSQAIRQEEYLIGLNVEGKRIAILLDHSGSMMDEKIINITLNSVESDSVKQQTPKWLTAKKTLKWLLNRVPSSSQVLLLGFNDKAGYIGEKQWFSTNNTTALAKAIAELEQLVPDGPTNLHAVLDLLEQSKTKATDIYLITDGLPTKGNSNDYNRRCKPGKNISGNCRIILFNAALATLKNHRTAKLNVILLPLEGDPAASGLYWKATQRTHGTLMSPAEKWP